MSLRYSIYKVQTFLSLSLTAFAFYHISFRLSRTFFKFFQTFLICGFARCSVSNFAMLAHLVSFVKHFFQILFKFNRRAVLLAPPAGDLHILAHRLLFVKHYFTNFSIFFHIVSRTQKGRTRLSAPMGSISLILHHRSGRSRRRFSYRQQQRSRRYPRPGKQRRYDPAGSSA